MTSTIIRLAGLAATAVLLVTVIGAGSADLQPSARLVLVAAVVGTLAPLFWPGRAGTGEHTIARIAGWSFAVTALAAVLAVIGGIGDAARLAAACGMLLLIVLVTHALAADLELLLHHRYADDASSREIAAWLATATLALLGATPLWLGPAAELATGSGARAIDAVVGVSPLTHVAVAGGNDLLRNQWFYQHSNLAGLQFSYPRLAALVPAYLVVLVALLAAPALQARRGPVAHAGTTNSTAEINT